MKGWVGLVGWHMADGLPTLVVNHQLLFEFTATKFTSILSHSLNKSCRYTIWRFKQFFFTSLFCFHTICISLPVHIRLTFQHQLKSRLFYLVTLWQCLRFVSTILMLCKFTYVRMMIMIMMMYVSDVVLTPVLSQSRRVLKEPTAKTSPSGLQLTAVMG